MPALGQNIEDFMGKDFIKYITEKNTKQDIRKQSLVIGSAKKIENEKANKYQLYSNIEYQKLDIKGDSKKEEFKQYKEILLKLHADREQEEKGTIFAIYRVGKSN